MTIVYRAYEKYLTHKNKKDNEKYKKRKRGNIQEKGNLWPSDMGKCKRAVMLRVNGNRVDKEFPVRALDYMQTGVITEDATLDALQHVYGNRLTEQVNLKHGLWSGKADFGIDIGGENPIIIEHKTTSEKNFSTDSTTSMPKLDHVGQAMLYCYLYEKIYKKTPTVILFYKAWGTFAEFVLSKKENKVAVESNINGVVDVFELDYDVYGEIENLELWYNSTELPDKLEKKWKGCTFRGKPSCAYYEMCWGAYG